ncbi:MAG: penicillin-binding protein activator [bacterium]|nr:penicillin-binding protein activator [bacterium]MDE0415598.1 penicillin-binding protein activator [bacterium]
MTRTFFIIVAVALAACKTVPENTAVVSEPESVVEETGPVAEPDEAATATALANGYKVGFLVPLSGEHGGLGRSVLDAATLALFDVGRDDIELVVADTAHGGAAAARQVVTAGVDAVIGPLLARSIDEAAGILAGPERHVFALTSGPAAAGADILVMGHTPDQQVRRLVHHAVASGNVRFALLAPRSAFGQRMAGLLRGAVAEAGGFVTAEVFHDPAGNDIDAAVETLAATPVHPGDTARAVAWLRDQEGLAAEVAIERLLGPGNQRAFDAVFLPGSSLLLQRIAAWMGHHDFLAGEVQLFGLQTLDDAALFREPLMNGAWFAVPPDAGRSTMLGRFRDTFGYDPDDAVTPAYDAMALVSAVISGPRQRQIGDWRGFGGIDGLFRFLADGRTERQLTVMRITPTGPVVEDAAPAAFAPPADPGA